MWAPFNVWEATEAHVRTAYDVLGRGARDLAGLRAFLDIELLADCMSPCTVTRPRDTPRDESCLAGLFVAVLFTFGRAFDRSA